ncbi:DNA polymerase I [Patescibacteria group bacterium]|nr:DNA polymerase I [Patescibacteria group bacterium]
MAKVEIIDSKKKIEDLVKKLAKQRAFVFNIEVEEKASFPVKLLGASFCFEKQKSFYVPCLKSEILNFKSIFENSKILKYGHDLKRNFEALKHAGINLDGATFDTMIAAYLLNPGAKTYKLENLIPTKFGEKITPEEELTGKGRKKINLGQVAMEKISLYSGERAEAVWRLVEVLKEELRENELLKLFENLEMPLLPVLAEMEIDGVKIDARLLKKYSKQAEKDLEKISEKIFKLTKTKFNLDSPIQLREVLFEKLKINPAGLRRGKTGISTEAGELLKLKDTHPAIDLILGYRELSKLYSTYLLALPKLIDSSTGRIHANFNQTVTATGRLSSSNPNLQNIPVRGEMGQIIRQAFVAPSGFKILAADYSHIDLRVVASLANDKNMIKAFRAGADIHRETASQIWNIPAEKVTPELRQAAKTINFGVTYGMGARALALGAGITLDEAKQFISKYFTVYEGVKNFLEETRQKAHDLGFVETLFGRRRYLPEIYSPVPQIAAEAERMAINMPVQGTAADIMKLAMIKIAVGLPKISSSSKMILQVHDELVFEVPDRDVKKVAEFVKETMAGAAKLKVPLASQIEVGKSWGKMEHLET